MQDELVQHLMSIGNLPYLFVGSGFSRRYIGMENWQDLLENICNKVDLPRPFVYYLTESNKDYPFLGELISDAFYTGFYNTDYSIKYPYIDDSALKNGNRDTPIKYVIANYINSKLTTPKFLLDEIEELKLSKVVGIIKTNWDCLLEELSPIFKKYIGQEMIFSEPLNYGEIFKIHGSSSKPDSMILTSRDYSEFDTRNAYLTAKLLTTLVEHPIIFLGYSLTDSNILAIIHSVFKCLNKEEFLRFKDRLIFVEYDSKSLNSVFMDGCLPLPNGNFLPIKHIKTQNFKDVFTPLQKLEQTIPTRLLVRLKDMFYDFVVKNKPGNKMHIDINAIDDSKLDSIQAAFGIGVAGIVHDYGYRSINQKDIIKDVLSDDNTFNASKLLTSTYSQIIGNIEYFPIYKYLKVAGVGSLNELKVSYPSFSSIIFKRLMNINFKTLMPSSTYASHKVKIQDYKTLKVLIEKEDVQHVLYYVHLLEHNNIDLPLLQQFLIDNFNKYSSKTEFRKAVCLYDILKYR